MLEPLSLDGARERFGNRISEEELLLRLTMPGRAGRRDGRAREVMPPRRRRDRARAPLVTLLQELARRPAISSLALRKDGETVVWRRA